MLDDLHLRQARKYANLTTQVTYVHGAAKDHTPETNARQKMPYATDASARDISCHAA